MNAQTQQAYEVLMNDQNGKLISEAHRAMSVESMIRTVDCETREERYALEAPSMAWRLAWKVGQAVGRNEWPGATGSQSQLDKIDFVEICKAWLAAWDARRDAEEAAQLEEIRSK